MHLQVGKQLLASCRWLNGWERECKFAAPMRCEARNLLYPILQRSKLGPLIQVFNEPAARRSNYENPWNPAPKPMLKSLGGRARGPGVGTKEWISRKGDGKWYSQAPRHVRSLYFDFVHEGSNAFSCFYLAYWILWSGPTEGIITMIKALGCMYWCSHQLSFLGLILWWIQVIWKNPTCPQIVKNTLHFYLQTFAGMQFNDKTYPFDGAVKNLTIRQPSSPRLKIKSFTARKQAPTN
jgi:hypothetical protein